MNERGNYVIGFALGLTVLVGVAAVVVDMGYSRVVRAQLQDGADAAAHGAVAYLDRTDEGLVHARNSAVEIAAMNQADGKPIKLDPNLGNDPAGDVVLGIWDWEAGVFTPTTDPELVDAVAVQPSGTQVSALFALSAFGVESWGVGVDSTAVQPPPTPAGAVKCYIPLAVPECTFDEHPDGEILDIDLLLNSDGIDNVGWALVNESPNADSLRDQINDCQNTGEVTTASLVELNNGAVTDVLRTLGDAVVGSETYWDERVWGPQPEPLDKSYVSKKGGYGNTFEGPIVVFDGGEDCANVKYTGDQQITGFAWAAVYDVVDTGSVKTKNIRVRLNTIDEFTWGTQGGGTLEDGVDYEPPAMIVR